MADLLEELAVSDHVNSSDLKSFKDEVHKQSVNKLNRLRKAERKAAECNGLSAHPTPLIGQQTSTLVCFGRFDDIKIVFLFGSRMVEILETSQNWTASGVDRAFSV